MTANLITTTTSTGSWRIEAEGGMGMVELRTEYAVCIDEDGDEVEGDAYLLIAGLIVNPASRGAGLGRQLLRAAIASVKGMPIKLSAKPLDEATDQDMLVAFYESEGFGIADEQGGDGVFMER